jgi:hypothetical protein
VIQDGVTFIIYEPKTKNHKKLETLTERVVLGGGNPFPASRIQDGHVAR